MIVFGSVCSTELLLFVQQQHNIKYNLIERSFGEDRKYANHTPILGVERLFSVGLLFKGK